MFAGIWADDSDEEQQRPGFGGFGGGKGSKDYTAPVSFISGGVKVGDKVTKEIDNDGVDLVTVTILFIINFINIKCREVRENHHTSDCSRIVILIIFHSQFSFL